MKPVDQTTFDPGKGNCFSACVASILEIGIEEVPFFMDEMDWGEAFLDWCEKEGVSVEFSTEFPAPIGEFCIVGGVSARDRKTGHSVVMRDGCLAHDPHPDRTGIAGEPWSWITLSRSGR